MADLHEESQFHLLRSRRFLPLFLTLFLGALNDNLFKNALLVLLVTASVGVAAKDTNALVNLAAGLFVLPFFLFSPLAGQLADKFEKAAIIRKVKLLEILIMLVGVLALATGQLWLMLVVLFAMGTQSAFFGPIKYSILPQHLRQDELIAGNAQAEMGTFVAILLGTMFGTMLAGLETYLPYLACAVLSVAGLGWLASTGIPRAEPHAAELQLDWNPFREMVQLVKLAREKRAVWNSILGISWFWMLGAAYLTQTPAFAVGVLNGEAELIALLLCSFTVGIGVGSLLCDRMSGHKVEIGLVPFGAFGLSLFGLDLCVAVGNYTLAGPVGIGEFLAHGPGRRVLLDMILIGMFGGFYIVPLNTTVQARTPVEKRARVIACNNVLNALFMVAASLLGILLLGVASYSIPRFYLILSLLNILVALYIFRQVPEFSMRFLIWLLSHSIYRVRHQGLENIPDRGAAILVCNHVSYVDALLLAGAVRRPIRFIMYKPIYDLPVLNFIFRTGGAIPICSRYEDEDAYQRAMDSIAEALERGDLLCLFPEGKLTADGEIGEFKAGIERILERTPVPVIPMALRGLWGSFFSRSGAGAFRKFSLRWLWRRIEVTAEAAFPPALVSAPVLQEKVQAMRGDHP